MLLKLCDLNKDSNNDFYGDKKEQDFFRKATGRLKKSMPYKKTYYGENKNNYLTLDNKKIYYSNDKERFAIQTAIKKYPNLINAWKCHTQNECADHIRLFYHFGGILPFRGTFLACLHIFW